MRAEDDLIAAKAALRRRMKAVRKQVPDDHRQQVARVLARFAETIASGLSPGVVAGYIAIREEADPAPLMRALAARGWRLALPRIEGDEISFRAFAEGDQLAAGSFGLSEPQPDAPVVAPDLLLVPLLAFDSNGYRLGYGRGYYDRALARLPGARAVGLAYACQQVFGVPHGARDRRLGAVLTENGLVDCRA